MAGALWANDGNDGLDFGVTDGISSAEFVLAERSKAGLESSNEGGFVKVSGNNLAKVAGERLARASGDSFDGKTGEIEAQGLVDGSENLDIGGGEREPFPTLSFEDWF